MGTREITAEYTSKLTDEEKEKIHKVWELGVLGDILILERYGNMCGWSELKLKKGKATVYRLTKPWGSERRKEHFFGLPTRTYEGDQFSFVEYISVIAEQEKIPPAEEFVQAGLEPRIENQYRYYLQRIQETKPN